MATTFTPVKAASLAELKKELKNLPPDEVIQHFLRVIKHKKENKELLSYLLFESGYEEGYREAAKAEIDEAFAATNTSGFYLAKKSTRRALRIANKYIKYSDDPETEIELIMHFCRGMKSVELNFTKSRVMTNLYERQLLRIEKALGKLHEDLQFDYADEVAKLRNY